MACFWPLNLGPSKLLWLLSVVLTEALSCAWMGDIGAAALVAATTQQLLPIVPCCAGLGGEGSLGGLTSSSADSMSSSRRCFREI